MKTIKYLVVCLVVISMFLSSCATAVPTTAVPQPTTPPVATSVPATKPVSPTAAPTTAPTTAPVATKPAADADRASTLIVQMDAGRLANPEMFNPYIPGARRDQGLHQAMWEPLFILNYQTGKIDPWLGESFIANKTLDVWTLKIQKGAYWSDGVPVTSNDVIYTINMLIKNAPTLADSGSMKDWVKELKKVDEKTVDFVLTKPNPRFLLNYFDVKVYTGLSIVPEHVWKDKDPLTFKNYDPAKGWPVFSGQFKLTSVNETQVVYARDDNWWGVKSGFSPLTKIKKLIFVATGTEEQATAMMSQHQLDYVNIMSVGAFKALNAKDANIKTWAPAPVFTWVDPCVLELMLNQTVKPWDDKDMRWVINYAMDRQKLVDIAYEGAGMLTKLAVPAYPKMDSYVKMLEDKGLLKKYPMGTKDFAKGEEILKAKGYAKGSDGYWAKGGKRLSLVITMPEYVDSLRLSQTIVELLQQFGIDAIGKSVANDIWWSNADLGKYESQLGIIGCGSINEPYTHMSKYAGVNMKTPVGERGNPIRWTGAAADEFAKIVTEMSVLPVEDPKINELWVKGMEIWLAEAVAIPTVQNTGRVFVFDQTYWTNWPTSTNDYIHGTLWWASDHEIWPKLEPVKK